MSDTGDQDENIDDSDDQPGEPCDKGPIGDVSLSLDTTLEILANNDRRTIIGYLRDAANQTATIEELANYLVSQKAKQSDEYPGHDHVQTTLHHVHIPKLVDVGLIDYDARNQKVRYWGNDRLERWHERIQNHEE